MKNRSKSLPGTRKTKRGNLNKATNIKPGQYSIADLLKIRENQVDFKKFTNVPESILSNKCVQINNNINNSSQNLKKCWIKGSVRTINNDFNKFSVFPKFARSSISENELKCPQVVKSNINSIIRVDLSLNEEIKLNKSETAWKPKIHTRLTTSNQTATTEAQSIQDLLKKVRGILNKLTPENCTALRNEMQKLKIETPEQLKGIIQLMFDKAVAEPNFSSSYAQLCSGLNSIDVKDVDGNTILSFNKLLISHCQMEFELITENHQMEKHDVDISAIEDPDQKLLTEQNERKIRHRSVGVIKFIAELFKLNMLTYRIMYQCVEILLESKHEETLECLCKLLTTIGSILEGGRKSLDDYFDRIEKIYLNCKLYKICNRVRFMLQDVMDLRKNNWIERRKNCMQPKKMEEIQKEIEKEEYTKKIMNYKVVETPVEKGYNDNTMNTPDNSEKSVTIQKKNFAGNSSKKVHKNRSPEPQKYEAEWLTPASKKRSYLDMDKFIKSNKKIDENTQLGTSSFYKWHSIKHTAVQQPNFHTQTKNMFSVLEMEQLTKNVSLSQRPSKF